MTASTDGNVADRLDFEGARAAVAEVARPTPLLRADALSEALGRPVLVKAECLQVTGSFKVRGAAARLAALDGEERERGVVACSSGNHGAAVAYVAERLGVPATIYVPDWVDPVKVEGIRARGAELVLAGATFDEAEARAVREAEAAGRAYVSAYDDPWVIAGQGTIGLEILDELGAPPAAILAPLSGGGLIGGIAAACRARLGERAPRAVAVSARAAAVMHASLDAGRPVELPEKPTLATALSGGIGLDNRHSFALVRDAVDEHVLVSEEEIRAAITDALTRLHVVAEGGGAVALAAITAGRWAPSERDGPVVVVLSGGNVASELLVAALQAGTGGATAAAPNT